MAAPRKQLMPQVEQVLLLHDWEPEHARHVASLALKLFDALRDLHGLKRHDRLMLEVAALLHDVGLSVGRRKHHKRSFSMILSADLSALKPQEKLLVATIARYHRRALPKARHKGYADLPLADRERVRKLAAILRVADGLDRSHRQAIREIDCRIEPHAVALAVGGTQVSSFDMDGALRKRNLFEKEYGRRLSVIVA